MRWWLLRRGLVVSFRRREAAVAVFVCREKRRKWREKHREEIGECVMGLGT